MCAACFCLLSPHLAFQSLSQILCDLSQQVTKLDEDTAKFCGKVEETMRLTEETLELSQQQLDTTRNMFLEFVAQQKLERSPPTDK
jgi:hypothetical protein